MDQNEKIGVAKLEKKNLKDNRNFVTLTMLLQWAVVGRLGFPYALGGSSAIG